MTDPTRTGYDTSPEGQDKEVKSELSDEIAVYADQFIAALETRARMPNVATERSVNSARNALRAAIQADRERAGAGAKGITAELLADLKVQYGMVGTRDVDVAAWNAKLDRAIAALSASPSGAGGEARR